MGAGLLTQGVGHPAEYGIRRRRVTSEVENRKVVTKGSTSFTTYIDGSSSRCRLYQDEGRHMHVYLYWDTSTAKRFECSHS